MSDGDVNEAAGESGEGGEGKGSGKKKLIIIVAAAVLVLLLGGGGAYFFLFSGGDTSEDAAAEGDVQPVAPKPAVFYDLPEMTVNLSTEGRTTYLKVQIALEVKDNAMVDRITPYLPRILDAFQVYLRELRPADLEGSAGLFRLKEELLRRINSSVYPAHVESVLFKEILVQ